MEQVAQGTRNSAQRVGERGRLTVALPSCPRSIPSLCPSPPLARKPAVWPHVPLTSVLTSPGGVQGRRASLQERGPQDGVSRGLTACRRVQQEAGGVLACSARVPGGPRQLCPRWLAPSVSRAPDAARPARGSRLGVPRPPSCRSRYAANPGPAGAVVRGSGSGDVVWTGHGGVSCAQEGGSNGREAAAVRSGGFGCPRPPRSGDGPWSGACFPLGLWFPRGGAGTRLCPASWRVSVPHKSPGRVMCPRCRDASVSPAA